MRLLVCGSRTWIHEKQIARLNDELFLLKPKVIIHGGARGADEAADNWARIFDEGDPRKPEVLMFRAEWRTHGKAAGPIRNERMLKDGKPHIGLAFGPLLKLDGRLTGTGDMAKRMLSAGLFVRWISAPDQPFKILSTQA